MKLAITVAAILVIGAGAASAQRGPIAMRDGSTIIAVGGGCLVQYGRRNERINNAQTCSDNDLREADRIASGGGRPGYGGGYGDGPGYGGGYGGGQNYGTGPGGNWQQTCRGGEMRGSIFRTECRTGDGRWNATILDMRNCPTGNAENRNGSLVCR